MTSATEKVARTFDLAYRNAGGRGDAHLHQSADATRGRSAGGRTVTRRSLHPDEGFGHVDLSDNVLGRHMPDGTRRLPVSDLRLVAIAAASLARAERRRAAISATGDGIDPAWSMTAHPVLAAALRLYQVPLETARLGDDGTRRPDDGSMADAICGYEHDHARASVRIVAGHLWSATFEETRTGLRISQNHGRMLARITVMDLTVPESSIAAMKGRLLSEALDHPLVDLLPDLRVHRLFNVNPETPDPASGPVGPLRAKLLKRPKVVIEVRARSVPLAAAPADVDVSWRRLPTLHFAEIE